MSSINVALPVLPSVRFRLIPENQLNSRRISSQWRRAFLLLELIIALFLAGTVALPLAQLPMKASQEQIKSLYRSQSQRLADSGFAKLKEILYKNEIGWSEIAKSTKERIVVFEDVCDLSLPPLTKKFTRRVTLKCIDQKVKDTQQWWLMVARVEISPQERKSLLFKRNKKSKNAKAFAHYLILHKSSHTP